MSFYKIGSKIKKIYPNVKITEYQGKLLTLPLSFRVIFRHLESLVIKYQFKVKDKVREKDVLAFCLLRNKNTLGDEYHNLMKFQVFSREVNDENCSKILPHKFGSPINAIDSDLFTKKSCYIHYKYISTIYSDYPSSLDLAYVHL